MNEEIREKMESLFREIGTRYEEMGVATQEISVGYDVHAFYRLFLKPEVVVHLHGETSLSSDKEARIKAELMNYELMKSVRERVGRPPGLEIEAVIDLPGGFRTFEGLSGCFSDKRIPYDADVLEKILAKGCGLLSSKNTLAQYDFLLYAK